jgi:hypothetical protein
MTVLCLLLCFVGLSTSLVQAQPKRLDKEQNWSESLVKRYIALRRRTLQLAHQRGWSISKNYSNSRVLQLQDVDAFGQPIYYTLHNTEAAQGTRTVAIQGGGTLPITLSGSTPVMAGKLGLWDGGRVLLSHQEFGSSRITQNDNSTAPNNHTTHLAGTLIGKGINAEARGMAYGAQLVVWDYTNDITELAKAAPNLLISNHAYGPVVSWVYNSSRPGADPNLKWEWWGNTAMSATEDYLFGFYTTKAQDLDQIAYNNPFLLMVRSADNKRAETGPPAGVPYFLKNTNTQSTAVRSSNDAYDVIPAEATAKNVLTVGAADVEFDKQNHPVSLSSSAFSGWGPTDDGRIKPDLLGIGTNVLSTLASSNTAYGAYTGTSMASANVAGSLFLLQELYAKQQAAQGIIMTGSQFMRAATLRGLALHTANRTNPGAGPDYRQGWGLLNTEAAARILLNEDLAHKVLQQTLKSGSTFTYKLVAQGNEPLVVTLSWTDPEGTATSVIPGSVNKRTPKLVNDLDLRLTDGKYIIFPFVLNPDQPGLAATTGDNIRDNVEQVYIANPTPGQTYTISVSHKGNLTYATQPFSVIVSGLRRVKCTLTANITPRNDTTICAGSTISLHSESPNAAVTYQWLRDGSLIPNADDAIVEVSQAGSYELKITDNNGCKATSTSVQVKLKTPAVSISPTGDQWLCDTNKPLQLKASGSSDVQFQWLRDGAPIVNTTTSTLTVNQPGSYQVQITQAGCLATSPTVTVRLTTVKNIDVQPQESELLLPLGAAVSLKASLDATYTYQWYRDDNALPNATTYRLLVTQPGVYKVQAFQQNCVGWSTGRTVHSALVTGTSSSADSKFLFFPNPAQNTLSIQYVNPTAKQIQVSIYDLKGVLQDQALSLRATNGQIETNLSVSHLPPGQYILRLTDGDQTQIGRFIKK